jgi:pantoate--beta-alanine ligase
MQTAATIRDLRAWRASISGSVGVVPTMGALHDGHLALVRRARAENDHVVVTIFVNPTQFGPQEDFTRYPRDIERDRRLLDGVGCDMVFAPETAEMYPADCATFVEVGPAAALLEGERRPGHFRGVATIVLKLLNIVQPTRAYFGEKDAQQLVVIRSMARALDVPVEIVSHPTVREADGLAMSSRNAYLAAEQRRAAVVLYRALRAVRAAWDAGERDGASLRAIMSDTLASEPLARVDYVSVADPRTMRELDRAEAGALASLAVFIGSTRLIDNIRLGS